MGSSGVMNSPWHPEEVTKMRPVGPGLSEIGSYIPWERDMGGQKGEGVMALWDFASMRSWLKEKGKKEVKKFAPARNRTWISEATTQRLNH